jgi:hypothetical protein
MCEFNSEKCTIECPKFSLCAFFYSQKKVSELQLQLNSLFEISIQTLENISKLNDKVLLNKKNVEDLFSAFYSYLNQNNNNLGEVDGKVN